MGYLTAHGCRALNLFKKIFLQMTLKAYSAIRDLTFFLVACRPCDAPSSLSDLEKPLLCSSVLLKKSDLRTLARVAASLSDTASGANHLSWGRKTSDTCRTAGLEDRSWKPRVKIPNQEKPAVTKLHTEETWISYQTCQMSILLHSWVLVWAFRPGAVWY